MFSDDFFYDGITEDGINYFIKRLDLINKTINMAETEEDRKKAEERRDRFYLDIESIKIEGIEDAIKSAEESGDNEKKTLLERIKVEVQNAKRQMYARIAPEIINRTVGLNNDPLRGKLDYAYWNEAKIEDLTFFEQEIDKIEINKENFQAISWNTNIRSLLAAIENAENNKDDEKKEKLLSIKAKIDTLIGAATIYSYRYQPGGENGVERRPDESILSVIDRMFEELGKEASASFLLNSEIYIYLTNAKDKDDFLKRLQVVSAKLEEYEKIKSPESIDYIKKAIKESKEDFETGKIQGMDKDVEGR